MCGGLGLRDYGVVFVLGLMVFRFRGASAAVLACEAKGL